MAEQANHVLRKIITQVKQQPEWDQSGTERQVVIAYFQTPSGFTGQVKMPLSDWKNDKVRNDKIFQAVADLEGPFWDAGEETPGEV